MNPFFVRANSAVAVLAPPWKNPKTGKWEVELNGEVFPFKSEKEANDFHRLAEKGIL